MSVINPHEAQMEWRANKREPAVQLYLSSMDGAEPDIVGGRAGGFPIELSVVPVTDWIFPDALEGHTAAIIQVDADSGASMKRFQKLAEAVATPLIAACYEPPLALVRTLLRSGAHDVVPLPLSIEDIEAALLPLRAELSKRQEAAPVKTGKLATVLKSVGGVGATALLGQLAIRFAQIEGEYDREVCLLDLDMQFGDVAFQLGVQPRHTFLDLLEAGPRLDGDLLRATVTDHASGLKIIAAPSEMMPIEALPVEQLMRVVELARREFKTVFVDLPTNWTNWSLSMVAQSDLILLVTDLTVAGLHRAKRQLDLLDSQGLDNLDVRIVVNRYEKSLARSIRPADVHHALGREIGFTVVNDQVLMRSAIEQGIPIAELKRKSTLGADIEKLNTGVAAALELER